MTTDLWPDITIPQPTRGIRQILEDAGGGLKEKTRGIVEFRVTPPVATIGTPDPLFPFRYRCDLYVPKLDYSFLLVLVESAPTGFPAVVKADPGVNSRVEDQEHLLAKLAEIFRSPRTLAVIQNLISMATD